jgi:hypothetical protein
VLTLTGEMAGLDVVDCLAHVSVSDEQQRLEGVLGYANLFALDDPFEVELHFVLAQSAEAQDDTPALDWFDDLGGGVAAQHEASGLAEVAYDHPQGVLGAFGQTVGLVQNDDFSAPWRQGDLLLSEGFYLVADHIDASLVGGIEFKGGFLEVGVEQLADDTEDG